MIFDVGKRKRKAYWVSFKIAWSYLRLYLLKKILGKAFYEKRINLLHQKNAALLKVTFLKLNGLFIKVGQLLSIMSKVLPEEYMHTLESLQDNTPSTDFETIRNTIEKGLGGELSHFFDHFTEKPIASASIGQVHKAQLKSGEEVVVKIKHPYIDDLAEIDLSIIENLINIGMKVFKVQGMDSAFEQVKIMIHEELDYAHEAKSIRDIKANCKNIKGLQIPTLFESHSTSDILTISFCQGTKITNQQQLQAWGIDPDTISHNLVHAFCEMILNHGLYHADPHPGNLLINEAGEIILLDFGAVGKLDEKMKSNIPMLIQTIILKDQDEMLDVLRKMGFVGKGEKAKKTAGQLIEAIGEFLQSGINLTNLDLDVLRNTEIFKLAMEVDLKDLTSSLNIPKDWFLLQRTALLVHGVISDISIDYDPLNTVQPYLQKFILRRENIQKILFNIVKKQAVYAISLPKKVNALLDTVNKGELKVNIGQGFKSAYSLQQQVLFAFLSILCFALSFVSNLYSQGNYETGFMAGGIFTGLLFLRFTWKGMKV